MSLNIQKRPADIGLDQHVPIQGAVHLIIRVCHYTPEGVPSEVYQ